MKELLCIIRMIITLWRVCQSSLRQSGRMRALSAIVVALAILVSVSDVGSAKKKRTHHAARASATVSKPENNELVLVHTVFRHGHRTPADTYPNDPYIDDPFAPFGWGQLTNVGRKYMFDNGEWLRKRFDKFLGDLYTVDSTWAQSTDSDRTRMSCALVLAGLWPPAGTKVDWNPNLNWQPTPIHAQDLDQDTLLLARKDCPRASEELESVFSSPEVKSIFAEYQDLFDELSEKIGRKVKNFDDIQDVYSTLLAEQEYGKELPEWTKAYFPDKLIDLTAQSFSLNVHTDELKRLKGGPLLKKIVADWREKATNTIKPAGRKIFVYAGHDSTIANLLSAFNVWDPQIPTFGILTLFELYQNTETKKYSVELFLRNSSTVDPYPLQIPGCTIPCPLEKVIRLTKDVTPRDWAEECKPKDPNYVAPELGGP